MAKKEKTPTQQPAQLIVITSVGVGRKNILIGWEQGESAFDLSERDNPLPGFYKAFEALIPLVATVCHFPAAYAKTGLRVVGLNMGSVGETATVSLSVRKDLDDAAKEFVFRTPLRLLAHPSQPGKYTEPLSAEDAALVEEALDQAKLYIRGERAQGQIAFEDEDGEGDEGDDATAPLLFDNKDEK